MKRPFFALLAAWVFLTRIPLPIAKPEERDFETAPGFYPLVGLAIGAIGAAGFALAGQSAALLSLRFSDCCNAAGDRFLHEDGLADLFDGLARRQPSDDGDHARQPPRHVRRGAVPRPITQGCYRNAFMLTLPLFRGAEPRLSAVTVIVTSRYARAEGIAKPVAKGSEQRR